MVETLSLRITTLSSSCRDISLALKPEMAWCPLVVHISLPQGSLCDDIIYIAEVRVHSNILATNSLTTRNQRQVGLDNQLL